ncbi:MAG: DUF3048 domain-containing protein [Clostridiales bacterium]|nr:DUF3048 domain-containing protein [Clostridiales bacterium]
MKRDEGVLKAAAFLAAGGILVLAGCARAQETAESYEIIIETEPETIIIETEAEPEEEVQEEIEIPEGMMRSYLTGELVSIEQGLRRPLAIMMSNDKEALPQYGINRAGVVYEAPVEGTMNRYMSIIEDYDDLERIGSVRSCRTYYVYFAREFDAIYAHYGQSTFAKPYLKYIDNINGVEGIGGTAYFRSKDRKAPHNAYASYDGIQKAIATLGYSQEYDADYAGHYQFADLGTETELGGSDVREAYQVSVGYSYNKPWFEYNEENGLYYRFQYGAAHEGDEGQIAVRNIIIQFCPAGYYATTAYRNINVHDDHYGYFITGGQAESITWKKDGEYGVTHYYDSEGNEIILNHGKTWVCICTTNDMDADDIVIEGKKE